MYTNNNTVVTCVLCIPHRKLSPTHSVTGGNAGIFGYQDKVVY